jgi:hypothetical protein
MVVVMADGTQEAMHRNACMVLVALTEDADGRKVLDALDQDYMTTLAKALQLIASKHDSAAMAHLDPPTRAIAARVLHALRTQGGPKWMHAGLHTQEAPITSMFASLFAVS